MGSRTAALGDLGGERLRRRQADPDAVAERGDGHTSASSRFRAEPGSTAPAGASAISQGKTLAATGPTALGCRHTPPPSSRDPGRARLARRRGPLSTTAPVKSATNADAGEAASSPAVPAWTIRPASMTATRSPSRDASCEVVGDEQGRHAGLAQHRGQLARRGRAGAGVERGQRLVEQQHARPRRQRARQRHALALAARQLRGRASARETERRSARAAPRPRRGARARARRAGRRRRSATRSGAGTARSPGTRSRSGALGRQVDAALGVEPDARRRT